MAKSCCGEHFVRFVPVQIEYFEKLLFFEKAAVNVVFGRRFYEPEKFLRLCELFQRKISCFFFETAVFLKKLFSRELPPHTQKKTIAVFIGNLFPVKKRPCAAGGGAASLLPSLGNFSEKNWRFAERERWEPRSWGAE